MVKTISCAYILRNARCGLAVYKTKKLLTVFTPKNFFKIINSLFLNNSVNTVDKFKIFYI